MENYIKKSGISFFLLDFIIITFYSFDAKIFFEIKYSWSVSYLNQMISSLLIIYNTIIIFKGFDSYYSLKKEICIRRGKKEYNRLCYIHLLKIIVLKIFISISFNFLIGKKLFLLYNLYETAIVFSCIIFINKKSFAFISSIILIVFLRLVFF